MERGRSSCTTSATNFATPRIAMSIEVKEVVVLEVVLRDGRPDDERGDDRQERGQADGRARDGLGWHVCEEPRGPRGPPCQPRSEPHTLRRRACLRARPCAGL